MGILAVGSFSEHSPDTWQGCNKPYIIPIILQNFHISYIMSDLSRWCIRSQRISVSTMSGISREGAQEYTRRFNLRQVCLCHLEE